MKWIRVNNCVHMHSVGAINQRLIDVLIIIIIIEGIDYINQQHRQSPLLPPLLVAKLQIIFLRHNQFKLNYMLEYFEKNEITSLALTFLPNNYLMFVTLPCRPPQSGILPPNNG